ncbi:MAG: pimeloyl-ACP methyl ester carboxylesterase [Acidimicrobiales bacterium]|jgi:pimeloyl-ACP methyl ester carboxylesterase
MTLTRGLVSTSAGQMHYRDSGEVAASGPPILVMHINQRSSAMYQELAAELAPHRRVIALDHPSFGMSDHVLGEPRIPDYGRWAFELLDQLGIEEVVLLGEAVSAIIAADMAVAEPSRVPQLVMVNCPLWDDQASRSTDMGDIRPQRPADTTGWPLTRTVEWVLEHDAIHAPNKPTQEWMDRMNRAQMEAGRDRWQLVNAMDAYDLAPTLLLVAAPTLLVWGEHFIYAANRDGLTSRIADHREQVIPGGRFDMCFEKHVEVGAAVAEFLI